MEASEEPTGKGGGVDVCMYLLACLRYALHCYDRYDVSLNA